MKLALLRHGRTQENLRGAYIGRTDSPLSEQGRDELRQYRRSAGYPPEGFLFSSPMRRCVQTCELLYPGREPVLLSGMRERDFGQLEGMTHREITALPGFADWGTDEARMPFPGGESWEAFSQRTAQGAEELFAIADGKAAVLVCHGGTIMALLERYMGGSRYRWRCEPGCGYLVSLRGNHIRIEGSIGT